MSTDTSSLSLGRETLIAFSAKIVLALLGFAGIVIFYRLLGNAVLGVYYTVLAAAKIGTQIPGGLSVALQKRVSEAESKPGELLGFGLAAYAGFVAVAVVVTAVSMPVLSRYAASPMHVYGGLAILVSLSLFAIFANFYSGSGHPGASFWMDALRSLLTLALQLALVVAGLAEFGLMYGLVGATVVTAIYVGYRLGVRPTVPSRETVDRTVDFAKWSVPTSFTQNVYDRVDVLILAWLVGSTAVGLYEPALRLTVPAMFIAISVSDSLTVKASGLSSLDQSVERDLTNAVSYTSFFSIPLFFGALAMPEAIMRTVYGPSAVAGAGALVGLALFQVFNSIRMPFDNVVSGMNQPQIRLYVGVLTLAVHLPLALFLGAEFGLEGVVAATVVAEAIRIVAYQTVSRYLFGSIIVTRPFLEQVASGGVMYAVVEGALTLVTISNWVWLLAVVGLGAATYFGTLLLVSSHFKLTVRNVLSDVFAS